MGHPWGSWGHPEQGEGRGGGSYGGQAPGPLPTILGQRVLEVLPCPLPTLFLPVPFPWHLTPPTGGIPPLRATSSATVFVNLLDLNDNDPTFQNLPFVAEVLEGTAASVSVYQVRCPTSGGEGVPS